MAKIQKNCPKGDCKPKTGGGKIAEAAQKAKDRIGKCKSGDCKPKK